MTARQERAEPEHREGFGGRVRRFIDDELSRALKNKDESAPATPATPAPVEETAPAHREDRRSEQAATDSSAERVGLFSALDKDDPAPATPATPAPVEETAPAHRDDRRSEQAAADSSAERVGLLNDPAGLRDQWQQVQGTFVDNPQRAVHQASVLVERTLQEIHDNVTRGQISDPTSTEDLRVSFQRYREFFNRLLSA
jgi:hypothetical protein